MVDSQTSSKASLKASLQSGRNLVFKERSYDEHHNSYLHVGAYVVGLNCRGRSVRVYVPTIDMHQWVELKDIISVGSMCSIEELLTSKSRYLRDTGHSLALLERELSDK